MGLLVFGETGEFDCEADSRINLSVVKGKLVRDVPAGIIIIAILEALVGEEGNAVEIDILRR